MFINANAVHVHTGSTIRNYHGSILENNGAITYNGSVFNNLGMYSGNGTFVGDFINGGTVSPGNSPGETSIVGDYTQLGTLEIEIGGLLAGEYDVLNVDGDVRLNSATSVLELFFASGFDAGGLSPGDTFDIILYTGVFIADFEFGTFRHVIQSAVSPAVFGLEYGNPGLVSLVVTSAPVPIPATVWLFGSGLVMLGWVRRKAA